MKALDVNSLFARAEQHFAAGRPDAARGDLAQVQRLSGDHPAVLHLLALVEKKRGDLVAARAAFERALRLAPRDQKILNNYANLLDSMGKPELALSQYDRALSVDSGFRDARLNRALLLQRLGRREEALAELDGLAAAYASSARFHSARGAVLRELGRLDDAAAAFDRALALEPHRLLALHGRARVAIERGNDDASSWYRRALAVKPDDTELQLGLAEALEAEGSSGAVDCLAAAVERQAGWTEGQSALARMRWEAGEGKAFARSFETALAARPRDRDLWVAYAAALAGADLHIEAADVAARGRAAVGEDDRLVFLEAVHASEAGDVGRGSTMFAMVSPEVPGRDAQYIRHLLRLGEYQQAADVADRLRAAEPGDVGAWALTGLIWRLLEDPRRVWLHEQAGLVATRDLPLSAAEIEAVAQRLRGLHRTRAHPIGQSLRGGTQTRGRLFQRSDPEIICLRRAIERAVADYWSALPPADPAHPLLRHRAAKLRFEGSWSVRLTDGGFHVAHVHPNGLLSSACYLAVPDVPGQEGWLQIGAAPGSLDLPLSAMRLVEPRPGRLALFPSTLYHGTLPFGAGERLTAAFDLVAE
jgi:tetratricopeptide (TPR) repeat protein